MNSHQYTYEFKTAELQKTKNSKIKEKLICTRDLIDPLISLLMDIKRQVPINGKIEINLNDENSFIQTLNAELSKPTEVADFEVWLESKFTNENVAKLKKHYSQGPLLSLAALTSDFADENNLVVRPEKSKVKKNLYQENGEVYYELEASHFNINDRDQNAIGTLNERAKFLYKLTDKGFEMQSFSTDSSFLKDMFLGSPPDITTILTYLDPKLDEIEKALIIEQNKLLEATPGSLSSKSAHIIPTKKELEEHQIKIAPINKTLNAIRKYKDNKIDIEDLRIIVKVTKELVDDETPKSKFLRRKTISASSAILQDLSDTISPKHQPAPETPSNKK